MCNVVDRVGLSLCVFLILCAFLLPIAVGQQIVPATPEALQSYGPGSGAILLSPEQVVACMQEGGCVVVTQKQLVDFGIAVVKEICTGTVDGWKETRNAF